MGRAGQGRVNECGVVCSTPRNMTPLLLDATRVSLMCVPHPTRWSVIHPHPAPPTLLVE
jgi:hypothetical protein